jgi:hypothetical protein
MSTLLMYLSMSSSHRRTVMAPEVSAPGPPFDLQEEEAAKDTFGDSRPITHAQVKEPRGLGSLLACSL